MNTYSLPSGASLVLLPLLLAQPSTAQSARGAAAAAPADAGLAWADFDGDGLLDVFAIAPGGAATLLRNLGDGTFEDRAADLASLELGAVAHAAWGDLDGDGHPDLLLAGPDGSSRLLHNGGAAGFVDVTAESGLVALPGALGARWEDYDADALEDLVVFGVDGPRLFHNVGGFLEPVELPVAETPLVAPAYGRAAAAGGSSTATPASPVGGEGDNGNGGGLPSPSVGTSSSSSVLSAGPGGVAATAPVCVLGLDDLASGACLSASSDPLLGSLYPLSQELFVDAAGNVGLGTTSPLSPLHLAAAGAAVTAPALASEEILVDASDAVLGLYSSPGGSWGSAIALGEIGGLDGGQLIDKWSIARTTSGPGSELRFTYGSDPNYSLNAPILSMEPAGNIGIGTTSPLFPLHIERTGESGTALYVNSETNGVAMAVYPGPDDWASFFGGTTRVGYAGAFGLPVTTVELMTASDNEGLVNVYNVGGEAVVSLGADSTSGGYVRVERSDGGEAVLLDTSAGDGYLRMHNDQGVHTVTLDSGDSTNAGFLQLYDTNGVLRISLDGSSAGKGRVTCDVLEIKGGADLVESFDTREDDVEPGTVLVIDPEHPGELRVSTESYDAKVAGVVSGAGGVDPGLSMGQEGVASGDTQVALTGRVYVKASAQNGPIRAGDRLTTSDVAGHAMRVSDPGRADGAVIGKAMSELDEGTGLVLVLVNLQ